MKRLLFAIFTVLGSSMLLFGQMPQGGMPELQVTGKVIDSKSDKPVPFATITIKHLRDSTFFTGAIADSTGQFLIEKVKPGRYAMSVSFIGFDTYKDTIRVTPKTPIVDLQNIYLGAGSEQLGEVVISEEQDQLQLGIDRKIFNVSKNSIATGGSALDVLRQVPTVEVDIDGKISLRGSQNLIVFINGKPSGLTAQNRDQILDQIPASNIDRVELITNPSAKFDAEGMSGIINIITKKKMPKGTYGRINVGVGTFHKYNASFSYTYRNNKWTFTNTLGFRGNRRWNDGFTTRTNLYDSLPPNSADQFNEGYRVRLSPTLSGNIDYDINKKTSLSLNYLVSYSNGFEDDSIRYEFLDSADWLTRLYYRNTEEYNHDFTTDVGLSFTHNFAKNNRKLTGQTSFTYIIDDEDGNFVQNEYTLFNQPDTTFQVGLSNNYQRERSFVSVTQIDYEHPFAKNYKVEFGAKATIRRFDNNFVADTFNYTENRLIIDSVKTNRFIYLDDVNAVYGNISGKIQNFGFQAGLRIEQTNVWGDQAIGNLSFSKHYINFFPSVFLTYEIKKKHQIQVSYTRRIHRPRSWHLNPFAEFTDPLNLRRGNPDLDPENIDAVELSYSFQHKAHTIITTGYFRHVNNVFQRFREIDSNGVSIVSFINLDRSINFGFEFISRNRWFKWWTTTLNVNIYRNEVFGTNQSAELSATNFNYTIRFQSTWKLGKVADIQASLFYMGPNTFPQGIMAEIWTVDAAVKFKMLKDKLNITINVRDLFDTRRFFIATRDDTFIGDVYRKRESRIGSIQITYKFGKSQPQRNRRRNGSFDGGMDMDMGM